jgi:hypothetical protein
MIIDKDAISMFRILSFEEKERERELILLVNERKMYKINVAYICQNSQFQPLTTV